MWDDLLTLVYLIGFFPSWKSFAIQIISSLQIEGTKPDNGDRGIGAFIGGLFALFWPITITGRVIFRWVVSLGVLKTPDEIRQDEKAELEKLRKLAKEFNLPMGDDRKT